MPLNVTQHLHECRNSRVAGDIDSTVLCPYVRRATAVGLGSLRSLFNLYHL